MPSEEISGSVFWICTEAVLLVPSSSPSLANTLQVISAATENGPDKIEVDSFCNTPSIYQAKVYAKESLSISEANATHSILLCEVGNCGDNPMVGASGGVFSISLISPFYYLSHCIYYYLIWQFISNTAAFTRMRRFGNSIRYTIQTETMTRQQVFVSTLSQFSSRAL